MAMPPQLKAFEDEETQEKASKAAYKVLSDKEARGQIMQASKTAYKVLNTPDKTEEKHKKKGRKNSDSDEERPKKKLKNESTSSDSNKDLSKYANLVKIISYAILVSKNP
jgi:hypothetical protein